MFTFTTLTMGSLISIVLHRGPEYDTRSDTLGGYRDMLCTSSSVLIIIRLIKTPPGKIKFRQHRVTQQHFTMT